MSHSIKHLTTHFEALIEIENTPQRVSPGHTAHHTGVVLRLYQWILI